MSSFVLHWFICLLALLSLSSSFVIRNTKMGDMRNRQLNGIIKCFERHSDQFRNKRVFASTQGNVAQLMDENGNEIDCTVATEEPIPESAGRYDQHCFFSPLNCFFSKLRLTKKTRT